MILFKSFLFHLLLLIPSSIVFAQTALYTAYQISFPYVTSCSNNQYYDTALLQCSPCPLNAIQKINDPTQCDCIDRTFYYGVNQGGGSLLCLPCNSTYIRSSDGFGCVTTNISCGLTWPESVKTESNLDGNLYTSITSSSSQPRIGNETCVQCQTGTWPDPAGQRCTPCASVTPRRERPTGNIRCCNASETLDGTCLLYVEDTSIGGFLYLNRFSTPTTSVFFQQHLRASFFLCRMNLNSANTRSSTRTLLSNATACQILANIATMQFFYGSDGYAYDYYDNYIWNPQSTPTVWTTDTNRTSIPFLTYPLTYYDEISASTYSWIPAKFTQNDLMRIKLAKYSVTGQFLGLVDAFDTHMQFCGGGYSDGRPAFTFGTVYKKSCTIRADVLWNSTLYETAFFDPYVVFTRNGSDYMISCPVVVLNYQLLTGTFPNRLADESSWIYHRRFFLVDRISGLTTNNELRNIHYAKSIRILTTLTSGETYIQPPVIIVEYNELSSNDIGRGILVQVTFESQYRMDLNKHILDIWIAFGVLAVLGIILGFFRTISWYSRTGNITIDLLTIGKFSLYLCNILGTIFFIIMSGVSLWWLIFFKRQDAISLVMPTNAQQVTFTVLVVVGFILKTFDILHLIFRQASADIFFVDWEKPKAGYKNTVSIWRTYFVANEFQEIQAFRRINVTFQLFFVLFLLKVINLENIATMEAGVNLFPSIADYKPEYNGILRVGIAFSMWLATAVVQYLIYVIFYQRFIEDSILNFVDLCSVSNISVFIFTDNLYGYYIHGLSPHGITDVNMKEMIMNLERESNQMSGTRGLQAKSDEQTFIIQLTSKFRAEYNILISNYQNQQRRNVKNLLGEQEAELLMRSYRNLNEFLCAFITHSLPNDRYTIYRRSFLEKLLNHEFQNPASLTLSVNDQESRLFIDGEKNFTRSLFTGHENSLFIWNAATFLFIDYFAFNYVLAAIITYIFNFIAEKMRLSFGRRNLAAKTLIPKNFLI
ncbi:unnamed protein product [Rotaria sordida]|uniref:Meckelin n=1 Tax=Rotaria sordida TaxID=392033 RepID=A0A819HLR7_9BILA|nr:unnamed protein product [Rotaria sordida]